MIADPRPRRTTGVARTTAAATVLAAICTTGASPVLALERPGDALHAYALEQHARAKEALEHEVAQAIGGLPEGDRFDLYRTANQLCGTWSQVAFLQSLLELASGVESPALEAELRATLRAQTQFVLWELDQADESLMRTASDSAPSRRIRLTATIRDFLAQVARTVRAIDDGESLSAHAIEPPR